MTIQLNPICVKPQTKFRTTWLTKLGMSWSIITNEGLLICFRWTAFSFSFTLPVVHETSSRNSYWRRWIRWKNRENDMHSTRKKSTTWSNRVYRSHGAWKWKTSRTTPSLSNSLRNWRREIHHHSRRQVYVVFRIKFSEWALHAFLQKLLAAAKIVLSSRFQRLNYF